MTVRVLIVDDQEPFRLAARMVVDATDGFEVVGEADTGEASVEMARELRPDLVLMDVNLPGINGLDATRRILAERSDSVIVLLLSTYEEEEYAPRAAECGASAYIPKAVFGPDKLESAWAAANEPAASSTGTRPKIVVPSPGADRISSAPPIASRRSAIPCSPVPFDPRSPTENPTPSSDTANVSVPSVCDSETVAWLAPAYFERLFSASSAQK